MANVKLSAAARKDLIAIRIYSNNEFGSQIADKYFLGFEDAFDRLTNFPKSGRPTPDIGESIRCLTHRRHRIFYEIRSDIVLIIRIIHYAKAIHMDFHD